jgi:hypothetical protein
MWLNEKKKKKGPRKAFSIFNIPFIFGKYCIIELNINLLHAWSLKIRYYTLCQKFIQQIFFFFGTRVKLMALCSTTSATPPVLFLLGIFETES